MQYIVYVKCLIPGEKQAYERFKLCETLEEAQQRVALAAKVFKPDCQVFEAGIYELTNY